MKKKQKKMKSKKYQDIPKNKSKISIRRYDNLQCGVLPIRYERKFSKLYNFSDGHFESSIPTVDKKFAEKYGCEDEGILTCDLGFTVQGKYYKKGPITVEELKEEISKVNKKLGKELEGVKYGDMINFNTYRGCGLWFVGYGSENKDLKLIKSYGEMGYGLPLEFFDAPITYFKRYFGCITSILERYVDPLRMNGCDQSYQDLIEKAINHVKNVGEIEGSYYIDENDEFKVDKQKWYKKKISVNTFPKSYYAYFEYQDEPSDIQGSILCWRKGTEGYDENIFVKQYEKRIRFVNNDTMVILYGTFRKILPWELCVEISKFIVW